MSAVPADLRTASGWRTALPAFLALLVAILLLYRDTAMVMVGIWWRSETFAHAFLVLPISLWLVWRRRAQLAALTPRAQPWMLLPLLVVAVVWFMSDLVAVNAGSQFAFVAMLVLAVPAVLGYEIALTILFPLLCIFAMRQAEAAEPLVVDPPLVVRDKHGRRTEEFRVLRAAMGMPA